MTPGEWILLALGALIVLFIAPTFIMSSVIYTHLLVRTKPQKWDRSCSMPEDEEYRRMFDRGMDWDAKYADKKRPVEITSDGLHLAGEYFDFGGHKAVLILAGRMESCLYSYYFAEPYRESGYNVLVIDNRAHGLSDGKYVSLGYKEYRDVQGWCRLLESFGNDEIILHGICIGASTALFAILDENAPVSIKGMVAEGMYVNFYESFKNHMIQDKRPMFPFLIETMGWIRILSGANVVTDGPLKRIPKLDKPILFLQSREDTYSVPEKAVVLYEACNAPKRLVWFDKGAHSRIRINDEVGYDRAVKEFLADPSFFG